MSSLNKRAVNSADDLEMLVTESLLDKPAKLSPFVSLWLLLFETRFALDALLFLWLGAILVSWLGTPAPRSVSSTPTITPAAFHNSFTVSPQVFSEGYGRGLKASDKDMIRFYLPPLPSRYMEQFYDEFMQRPVGGTGKGHEEGWALPLGHKLSLNATTTWPSAGPVHLYHTDQLANDVWWFTQVANSPLRVRTYEEADVVFVPGMFARADPGVESEQEYAQRFRDFNVEYMPYLPNVTDKPHVVGFPRVVWPNVDDFRLMTSLQPLFFTALEPFTGRDQKLSQLNEQIIVIPYQGNAHYDNMPREPFNPEAVRASKQLLVASSYRSRKEFRLKLREQCEERPDECVHHEFQADNATDMLLSWELATRSWYCLQPPGDTPTRRSMYDCMLAGTIPIVFDYTIIDALPFSNWVPWHDMLVVMSAKDVETEGANIVDSIRAQHSEAAAMIRLRLIEQYRPLLQYGLAPTHEHIRYSSAWQYNVGDDAFTGSWKAIVQRLCIKGRLPHSKCCAAAQYKELSEESC